MKLRAKDVGIFILWGVISAIAFKIFHPSTMITQSIFVFVIGSVGAIVGNYFRKKAKE